MKRSLLAVLLLSITAGCAQPPTTEQARNTGQVVAKDAKEAGAAIAHGAREVGRTVKDAAVGAWDATRQGAQAVGAAASGAAGELRK
jgi:hypothetical protein